MNQYDCVIFVAHPDDAFLGMGGTISKLVSKGKTVLLVCASFGENGNSELGKQRLLELKSSVSFLKIDYVILHFEDGKLTYLKSSLHTAFSDILVKANPLLVVTHPPFDRHSDHLAVRLCCLTAVENMWHHLQHNTRLRQLVSFAPISLELESLSSMHLNLYSDISRYSQAKESAVQFHISQQPYLGQNLRKHQALSIFLGSLCSCQQAEGFYCEKQVVDDFFCVFDS